MRRPPERLGGGPRWWHGALAGAAIAVAQSAVVLPFTIVRRIRAIDVGLNTRSWLGWAWDWVLSVSINAVLMGLLAVALLWLMRRLPRAGGRRARWWWSIVAVGWTLFSPVVLDPLFNRFEPLRPEPLRSQVLALAREAGVDAQRGPGDGRQPPHDRRQRVRRGPRPHASGSCSTTTCCDDFTRAEQLNIVAHELGHEHYGDVRRGLLYVAIVAPFGMLAVALLTRRLTPGTGPVVLPALALSILLVTTGIGWISNPLSRQVEARADTFALRTTDRSGRADRAPAPAGDPQRLRSRPARLGHGGVRDAPTADGSDRERVSRAAARASTSSVVAVALVQVTDPHPDWRCWDCQTWQSSCTIRSSEVCDSGRLIRISGPNS